MHKTMKKLELFQKVQRVEAPPFLMTRIEAKSRAASSERLPVSWQWAAVVSWLALLNVISLSALWKRPAPPHHEGPRKIIVERLQLDAAQVAAYDLLIENT